MGDDHGRRDDTEWLYAPDEQHSDEWGRKRRWLWARIIAGGLLFVALCAVGVALLRPAAEPKGNLGVEAARQYITEYRTDREALVSDVQKELGERLMTEPFEMAADVTITSDDLPALGVPVDKLVLGLDAKYDMIDLGVKLRVLGLEYGGAYLIGDDVVLNAMGKAYSVPINLPVTGDLSQSMGLQQRLQCFEPLLPDYNEFYEQLLAAAAQCVPDEYTRVYTDSVYSPLDGADAEMTVIETALDEAALQTVAQNLDAYLEDDDELRGQIQQVMDEAAQYRGLETSVSGDWLKSIADGSALAGQNIELLLSVYQREGRYVGLEVQATQNDTSVGWRMMTELSGNKSYELIELLGNGVVLQNAEYTVLYDDGRIVLTGTMGAEKTLAASFSADVAMERNGDAYRLTGEAQLSLLPGEAAAQDFAADIDADIRVGEGLETLAESSGWQDIYSETWNSLDGDWEDMLIPSM